MKSATRIFPQKRNGRFLRRGWPKTSNQNWYGSVVVIVVGLNNETVLIRESKYRSRFWKFPGGKRKDGESFEIAASRELHEEVGLIVSPRELKYLGKQQRTDHETCYFACRIGSFDFLLRSTPEREILCLPVDAVEGMLDDILSSHRGFILKILSGSLSESEKKK